MCYSISGPYSKFTSIDGDRCARVVTVIYMPTYYVACLSVYHAETLWGNNRITQSQNALT